MGRILRFSVLAALAATSFVVVAQTPKKYTGPRPPKADIPYLVHASELVSTEVGEAKEDTRKDEMAATVSGAASPVRTPMAEPIFLIATEKLNAEKIELYRMNVKGSAREVVIPTNPKKIKPEMRPVRLSYNRLEPGLYKIEAGQILENGEYCLSPSGSSQVFCFQVY